MDQLLEGVPMPGGSKTRQILRAAPRDPLSQKANGGLFTQGRTTNRLQAVMAYAVRCSYPKDPQWLNCNSLVAMTSVVTGPLRSRPVHRQLAMIRRTIVVSR
jgi:hypothetical protein